MKGAGDGSDSAPFIGIRVEPVEWGLCAIFVSVHENIIRDKGGTVINKIVSSFDEAVADVYDGAIILIGGFGPANGCPSYLIRALVRQGAKNLTIAANTPGRGRPESPPPPGAPVRKTPPNYDDGGLLIQNDQVTKAICAFPGTPPPGMKAPLNDRLRAGKLEVELVPQGTLRTTSSPSAPVRFWPLPGCPGWAL